MWQIVLNGPGYLDTGYDLPDGETLLGRGEDNHIVLAGALVSRRHARLLVRDGLLFVADAASRNGTLVGGTAVEGMVQLQAGDRVQLGETSLLVRSIDARLSEATVLLRQESGPALARLGKLRALDARGALAQSPEMAALVLLYQVSERLGSARSLQDFLEAVADLVLELARARTVVVLLGAELTPVVVRHAGAGLAAGEVPISHSVADECLRTRTALCVADVSRDARFATSESVVLYGASQVICAPLLREGAIEGLLYVTRDADDDRLEPLLEAIAALGHLAGAGIEQHRLRERAAEEERLRHHLARFLGAELASELGRELYVRTQMVEREATVIFADISGFTQLTERLPVERTVALLDAFYRCMARVIFSFGGTVDKFIGDAVMAIFGAPRSGPDDAVRALRAALAIREEFEKLVADWPEEERCRLKVGMNTGRVLAGTVGGGERLEYTAVGDAVNVAARLVAEAAPGQILAGGTTLAAAGDAGFSVLRLGPRQLRGKSGSVEVVEVLGEER